MLTQKLNSKQSLLLFTNMQKIERIVFSNPKNYPNFIRLKSLETIIKEEGKISKGLQDSFQKVKIVNANDSEFITGSNILGLLKERLFAENHLTYFADIIENLSKKTVKAFRAPIVFM